MDRPTQKLKKYFDVEIGKRGEYNSEENLIRDIPKFDALISMLSNPVTGDVIRAGKRIKIIANHAVGYNNIDLQTAKEMGIKVANTPDVLTESTADCALGLLLTVARKICAAQQYIREGKFHGWEPLGFLGMELNGKNLGIIGMGRIGTAVARRAKSFGLNIIYHNRKPVDEQLETELDARYMESVEELSRKSDILSLNCPFTDKTHHLIDRHILDLLPDHAIIINTARGPVIDESALANALHNNIIGGAGIDVFEEEPKVHPDLKTAPNCVITPHIGSATEETREAIGMLAVKAVIGILEQKPESEIPNLIQP